MKSDSATPTAVLYVGEPDDLDRTVSALVAAGDGLDASGVETAAAAVEAVESGPVDCIVTSHDPPERDVLWLLDALPGVPVVLYAVADGALFAAAAGRLSGFVERRGEADAAGLATAVERAVAAGPGTEPVPDLAVVGDAVDALDDVFYVYDGTGGLTHWNAHLNELFGLTDAELAGMHATEFFVPEDHAAIGAAVTEALTEGTTVTEARAETVDGLRRFQLTGRRLTDETGATVGFCGIGRDVTDSREREWRLSRQNERLEEFATVVSHDLRNPLTVAMGFLDVAREEAGGETPALDRVADALDRMADLVEDVLTAARDGQEVTDPVSVDLAGAARRAWQTVDTADAVLDVRTTGSLDGDPRRLARLFENLYRNAVEHAGADVTVVVEDTTDGFAVWDDGPGIPEADRRRAFEPGVSSTAEGTGFGLYIVRTIAEAHGWSVALEPASGGGARFAFTVHPDRDEAA